MQLTTTSENSPDLWPNCWIAPGFDPLTMINDMALLLNGEGGQLEQSYLYLDLMSASGWCNLSNQEDYLATENSAPLDYMAKIVRQYLSSSTYDQHGLDVITLGSGDGRKEVRLVNSLLNFAALESVRLYLLDISQPLLSEAFKYAADMFSNNNAVNVTAIQGNMHHLARYKQLIYSPKNSRRRRLVTMIGHTFGNLSNELLFARNSLGVFSTGDLLLLDMVLAYGNADSPEELYKKDPRLSGKIAWQNATEKWLAGPIDRYRRSAQSIEFQSVLDNTTNCVPGSYTVEIQAKIDGQAKFTMWRLKRYDPNRLIEALEKEGWLPLGGRKYSNNDQLMYLFEKQ